MKKKSSFPQTKVKNPEPKKKDENWIIWAAWADSCLLYTSDAADD